MSSAIVLVPDSVTSQAVAETVSCIAPAVEEVIVVCDAERETALSESVDARTIADRVPDGGSVAALRAGLRATSASTAVVTTPGAPSLPPGSIPDLAPVSDAEATIVEIGGDRHLPLGGYAVGPALAACDVTLATGSRRFADVLARLTVTTQPVSVPGGNSSTRAKHES